MSDMPVGFEDHRSITRFDNPFLRMKVLSNPNYFVPNDRRTFDYLHLDRSQTTFKPNFLIPLGRSDAMRYSGWEKGGVNDRPLYAYQKQLFPDDFVQSVPDEEHTPHGWTAEYMLREEKRKDSLESIFGGYEAAFHAGKTVLDIGSGQALGVIQLALQFPNTSFIGLDILYEHEKVVFPGKPGLQLTKGDWRSLRTIPDNSVDTILSLQGVGMWGIPGSENRMASDQDGKQIIAGLTRVAKPGAVVRIDFTWGRAGQYLNENMDKKLWETTTLDNVFIAKKDEIVSSL